MSVITEQNRIQKDKKKPLKSSGNDKADNAFFTVSLLIIQTLKNVETKIVIMTAFLNQLTAMSSLKKNVLVSSVDFTETLQVKHN